MDSGPREGTSSHERYLQVIGVEHLQMFVYITRHLCGLGKINASVYIVASNNFLFGVYHYHLCPPSANTPVLIINNHNSLAKHSTVTPLSPPSRQLMDNVTLRTVCPNITDERIPASVDAASTEPSDSGSAHAQGSAPPFPGTRSRKPHSAMCQRTDCRQFQKLAQSYACMLAAKTYDGTP